MSADYSHILECHNVPVALRGGERLVDWVLSRAGRTAAGLRALWHSPDIALLVFPNGTTATEALSLMREQKEMRVCSLRDGFRKQYEQTAALPLPGPTRADTDVRVASRLIRGALGSSLRRERGAAGGGAPGAPPPAAHGQAAYLRPAEPLRSKAEGAPDWRASRGEGHSRGEARDAPVRGTPAPRAAHASASAAPPPPPPSDADAWPSLSGGPAAAAAAKRPAAPAPAGAAASHPRPPVAVAAAPAAAAAATGPLSFEAQEWAPAGGAPEDEGGAESGVPVEQQMQQLQLHQHHTPGVWREVTSLPARAGPPAGRGGRPQSNRGGRQAAETHAPAPAPAGPGAPYVAQPPQQQWHQQQQQRRGGGGGRRGGGRGGGHAAPPHADAAEEPVGPRPRVSAQEVEARGAGGFSRIARSALRGALRGGAPDAAAHTAPPPPPPATAAAPPGPVPAGPGALGQGGAKQPDAAGAAEQAAAAATGGGAGEPEAADGSDGAAEAEGDSSHVGGGGGVGTSVMPEPSASAPPSSDEAEGVDGSSAPPAAATAAPSGSADGATQPASLGPVLLGTPCVLLASQPLPWRGYACPSHHA